MANRPPIVLSVARDTSATLLGMLLALFVLRVFGQILAATVAPQWIPPMARWYSGLMPYRYLLPTQLAFVVVMVMIIRQVATGASPLGGRAQAAGAWIIWASYVYALGMVVRAVRYALATPERRGVLIPIVFHFVLAAFLFVWGSALFLARSDSADGPTRQLG
jgi:uncharacterized membrane protein required for colicin V production